MTMFFSVQHESRVRICLPGGLHESVLMEVLANAVGEPTWSQDHVGAAIDSRGDLLLTGLGLDVLVWGLQGEQSRWSYLAEERGDQLRQLHDLDRMPAHRVDDLMAWQRCVLRHEHATVLLALVREAAASEHGDQVPGGRDD